MVYAQMVVSWKSKCPFGFRPEHHASSTRRLFRVMSYDNPVRSAAISKLMREQDLYRKTKDPAEADLDGDCWARVLSSVGGLLDIFPKICNT